LRIGILVPVIPLVYLPEALTFIMLIEKAEYLYFSFTVAMVFTSATLWLLGKKFSSASDKVLIDPETNQEVIIKKNKHTFFWIPMHWFAVPAGILAILFGIVHFMLKEQLAAKY